MKLLLLLSVFTFHFVNSSVHICEHGQEIAESKSSLCSEHQEHGTSTKHDGSCIGCCFNHYFQTVQVPNLSYKLNLIGTAQFHFVIENTKNYQLSLLRPPIA